MERLKAYKYGNSLVLYAFEYIWKWMYIRTQRALAVGVSDILKGENLWLVINKLTM